jgi:amino-acid N-acetyltransferase
MDISAIPPSPELLALLTTCALPIEDIAGAPNLRFFGCHIAGELQGLVGLELYARHALLRSLAVHPQSRQRGLGKSLVDHAEDHARALGVECLYLLTTTAEGFFARLGYAPSPRETAPAGIRDTAQFTGLCPATAAFLGKRLAP